MQLCLLNGRRQGMGKKGSGKRMGDNSCKLPPLETFGCLAYNVFGHHLVSRAFPLKVGKGKRKNALGKGKSPGNEVGLGNTSQQLTLLVRAVSLRTSLHKHCILSRSILYFFWHCLFLVMITSGLYARLGERQKTCPE